jgi:nucleotide-binding universal stress UspA family protein
MPNVIRFDVHDAPRQRWARVHGAPLRAGKRSEPGAPRRLSRILVATDGTAASEGAVIVAGLLARRHRGTVDVVSVLPRWGQPPPQDDFLGITRELTEERLATVIPQGRRALESGETSWTVRVIDSTSVVDGIVEAARRAGHDLIVTGSGRGWLRHWFRRPTGLRVAERSSVPVLVIPPSVSTLPARAVVRVEGADVDFAAATSALGVLGGSSADLYLVHVDGSAVPAALETERTGSTAGWALRFTELERAIADSGADGVNRVVLRGGEPSARLAAYANGVNADLVVAGVRPPVTIAERFSGAGSRILRAADGCVLLCGTER